MKPRPWHVRGQPLVDGMLHVVFIMTGMSTYGPRWWAFGAIAMWLARAALLHAIWRHDDRLEEG